MEPTSAPTPQPSRQWNWPVAALIGRLYRGWRTRHQLPLNFVLHLIGIPTVLVGIVLLFLGEWIWGAALFFVGYLFQYLGHLAEGNDVGELIPFKRLLGLPVVAIAPRWQQGEKAPGQA
jgi:hypothetical protein